VKTKTHRQLLFLLARLGVSLKLSEKVFELIDELAVDTFPGLLQLLHKRLDAALIDTEQVPARCRLRWTEAVHPRFAPEVREVKEAAVFGVHTERLDAPIILLRAF